MKINVLGSLLVLSLLWVTCGVKQKAISPTKKEMTSIKTLPPPDWAKSCTIYEVNLRQYSKAGTFKAFEKELPRLQKMGVNVVWFMPIQPIGVKNRKGTLGSYYSISDYTAVNPEFGNLDDFKRVVEKAHSLGMKVMLDWVANHTAWDHVWITKHPEWFTQKDGKIVAPVADWADVADLNYDNKEMRHAMVEALQYWVKTCDIDGYRCDMAMMVPLDFWENDVRAALDKTKQLLWLAEAEGAEFHKKAFHITYGWEWHHLFNDIAQGRKKAPDLDALLEAEKAKYPANSWRLQFTSNHDENTWSKSETERMPTSYRTFAVLAATLPGVPLVYSGQESASPKTLKFFERDPIDWGVYVLNDFYTKLLHLKANNAALWNGENGGDFHKINTNHGDVVYAFTREKGDKKVVVIANLSGSRLDIALLENQAGDYQNALTFAIKTLKQNDQITLNAWDVLVLDKKKIERK